MTGAGFRLVRKGYEPTEVDQAVTQLQSAITKLQADLAGAHDHSALQVVEITKQRQLTGDLSGRITMLEEALAEARAERDGGVPPTFANLGARVGQMLSLAQEEADDLRGTARAEAEKLAADSRQQAADTIADAQRQAADTISRAKAEAARAVEAAKQQSDHLRAEADAEATARREEAEALYEAQRAQSAAAAADFEQTLAERRTQAMNELNGSLEQKTMQVALATEELTQARSEAERVTTTARDQAEQIVREAQTEASTLLADAKRRAEGIRQNSERELAAATARRDSITAQLSNVRQMLATLGGSQLGPADPLHPRTAQAWTSETDGVGTPQTEREAEASDEADAEIRQITDAKKQAEDAEQAAES